MPQWSTARTAVTLTKGTGNAVDIPATVDEPDEPASPRAAKRWGTVRSAVTLTKGTGNAVDIPATVDEPASPRAAKRWGTARSAVTLTKGAEAADEQEMLSPRAFSVVLGRSAEAVYGEVQRLFGEADMDNSGFLDRQEIAMVMQLYFKVEGTARSAKKIQEEVDTALVGFATPGTDQLDLHQFVEMLFGAESSHVRCTDEIKDEVRLLAGKPVALSKLHQVHWLFDEADTDGSGVLEREEIAKVIQKYHRGEGDDPHIFQAVHTHHTRTDCRLPLLTSSHRVDGRFRTRSTPPSGNTRTRALKSSSFINSLKCYLQRRIRWFDAPQRSRKR